MAQTGTANHRDAEQRMRELIENAGLPEPDEVRYEFDPNEVVFMWRDPKLAVVVDLDEPKGLAH
jgi:hypothetical protein